MNRKSQMQSYQEALFSQSWGSCKMLQLSPLPPPFLNGYCFLSSDAPKHFIIPIFYWGFLIAKPPSPCGSTQPLVCSASLKPITETTSSTELIPASLTCPLRILQKEPKSYKMLSASLLLGCSPSLLGDSKSDLISPQVYTWWLNTISLTLFCPCFISPSDSEIVHFIKVMTEFPITTIWN